MRYIYTLTNPINNKKYIGQTKNIRHRWAGSGVGYKGNKNLWFDINEIGWSNFIKTSFTICDFMADFMESHLISLYKTSQTEFGYNKTNGGRLGYKMIEHRPSWNKGIPMSEEQKLLLSTVKKGKCCGDKNGMYGKKHTAEAKASISRKNGGENSSWFGRHHTEDEKRKIGEAQLGEKNHRYGKNNSEEWRDSVCKKYEIISPNGEVYYTNRLKQFCSDVIGYPKGYCHLAGEKGKHRGYISRRLSDEEWEKLTK